MRVSALGALPLWLAVGCAPTVAVTRPRAAPPPLVIFLADAAAPGDEPLRPLAAAVNQALGGRFRGQPGVRVAAVPIGDALAVVEECHGAPTAVDCLAALAEQNHAPWLVVPRLERRGPRGAAVTLILFDRRERRIHRRSQRHFDDLAAAERAAPEQVAEVAQAPLGS